MSPFYFAFGRCSKGVACSVECRTESIAYDLKDIAVVGFDRATQNSMVPRPRGFPRVRIFLREFRTAFDVGEEEGDGAGG